MKILQFANDTESYEQTNQQGDIKSEQPKMDNPPIIRPRREIRKPVRFRDGNFV